MITLTDEQQQEAVAAALEQLRETAKATIQTSLRSAVEASVSHVLHDEVKAFVETEIMPAVRDHLVANKSIFIEAAVAGAGELADEIRKALVARLAKTLASDYDARRLFKAMVGDVL